MCAWHQPLSLPYPTVKKMSKEHVSMSEWSLNASYKDAVEEKGFG